MRHHLEPGFPYGGRYGWLTGLTAAVPLLKAYFSFSRAGREKVPGGPIVVAANHFSHLDPVVAGLGVDRPVRYLAVDELYGNAWFFDALTIWLGAIPMSRTRPPFGALRLALAELADGGAVGVFPEGVRVWRWGEKPPKLGAAWLARRAGAPLVPVAICGTDQAMGRGTARISRAPVHVEVCDPIFPADFASDPDPLGSMTELWRNRVGEVLDRWYEG